MSITRKRVIPAGVVVLVCGVVITLMLKPAAKITLTLLKVEVETNQPGALNADFAITLTRSRRGPTGETNDTSRVALIFVKSALPQETYVRFGAQPAPFNALRDLYEVGGSVGMLAPTGALVRVSLPTRRPCVVFFAIEREYAATWLGRARSWCDRHLLKRKPYEVCTLDIPE